MPSAQTKPDDACRVLCVALLSVLAGRQNPELRMADAAVSFEQDSYEKGLQMIKDGQCVQHNLSSVADERSWSEGRSKARTACGSKTTGTSTSSGHAGPAEVSRSSCCCSAWRIRVGNDWRCVQKRPGPDAVGSGGRDPSSTVCDAATVRVRRSS
eukprot:889214-Rhodomonas_salina.3